MRKKWLPFTGRYHDDNTWEIRHRWLTFPHYWLCWLMGVPHLQTVDEQHEVWFRRWWIVKLPFWSVQVHHYPSGATEPEAFGSHRHPRWAWTYVFKGGYCHKVWAEEGEIYLEDVGPRSRSRGNNTWLLSPFDYHRVQWMRPGTRSVFVMVGRWRGWHFKPDETIGSSRLLEREVPVRVRRHTSRKED